jgi:hypothetical protein
VSAPLALFDEDSDPDARHLVLVAGALVACELLVLGAYFSRSSYSVVAPRYVLYPFVWVNVALLALLVVDRPRVTGRRRLLALGAGVGYLLVLTWLDGTLGAGTGARTLRVLDLPPGWGPALLYDGVLRVVLFPFKTVGYAVLAYLVYRLVADVASAGAGVVGGAIGFFSCVSCTLPVAAAALSGLLGGTVGVVGVTAGAWSYDLSTLAYVVSVGLLAWRPAVGAGARGRD